MTFSIKCGLPSSRSDTTMYDAYFLHFFLLFCLSASSWTTFIIYPRQNAVVVRPHTWASVEQNSKRFYTSEMANLRSWGHQQIPAMFIACVHFLYHAQNVSHSLSHSIEIRKFFFSLDFFCLFVDVAFYFTLPFAYPPFSRWLNFILWWERNTHKHTHQHHTCTILRLPFCSL